MASGQVETGDFIDVDLNAETGKFTFSKRFFNLCSCDRVDATAKPENDEPRFGGIGMLIPEPQAASIFCS